MRVAETYVGHQDDPDVAVSADPERVVLSDTERRRSRVRTETTDGRDIGIVVARNLGDGDVLVTEDGDLVVVELAAVDALALSFDDVAPLTALELGHALGNRHWDLALRDDEALFPVPDTRERMTEAVDDLLPEGAKIRFERVPPPTFDDGGDHADHAHGGDSHGQSHDDGNSHSHDDSGHSHDTDGDGHSHDHGVHPDDGVRTVDGGGR